jgi:hypothetical protein
METTSPLGGMGYARLNLRWNPFGTLTAAEKKALTVPRLGLSPYIQRLQQPGYALQFSHRGARGKTTHLFFLQEYFPQSPYICFQEGVTRPDIGDSPIYFLDQLHLLPLRQRIGLLRRPASFAIVSHRLHTWEFRAAGLDYEVIRLPIYTIAALKEVIDRRIAWARCDLALPIPQVSEVVIGRLLNQLKSDYLVIQYLYERVETWVREQDGSSSEWDSVW